MSLTDAFEIRRYQFNASMLPQFESLHQAKNFWPLVYILTDGKKRQAYVGETVDTLARMQAHLKHHAKNQLTAVHLITSNWFNKSATLDIESNLIKYISADGQFQLLNANLGLVYHNYYQKQDVYWELFRLIWSRLRAEGIAKHALDHINNSDLFKYSPYKALSSDQRRGLRMIMEGMLDDKYRNLLIEGGAGTGKTILAVFLFKLLATDTRDFNFAEFGEDELLFIDLIRKLKRRFPNPNMALVVPMSSFRNTLKKVFRNVKGLSASMVIGPAEATKDMYDIILVDEAHRLRRRVNLGTYFRQFDDACKRLKLDRNTCSELDWVIKQSEKTILFYDPFQSIKPSDTRKDDFDKLVRGSTTKTGRLRSQLRAQGGNDYVEHVDAILNHTSGTGNRHFNFKEYEVLLFDSIGDLLTEIKKRNTESGLSRLIAGYSWKWVSKKSPKKYDINIDGIPLRWNKVSNDWINSLGALDEVGCIHTTQGYDLNYAGVIFGNEIVYNEETHSIEVIESNYFDRNGKSSIKDPAQLREYILNIYRTIMLRGIKGTYVYACDEKLRKYLSRFIAPFRGKQSVRIIPYSKVKPFTNAIPLYDLRAAAGEFGELKEVADHEWIELPVHIQPSNDLFACSVVGDSMNNIVPNGSICLFRKYSGGSRDGLIVLAELFDIQDPDTRSSFTVKEYRSRKIDQDGRWVHTSIILKPMTNDPSYKPIVLEKEQIENIKVLAIFQEVLGSLPGA